MYVDSVRLRDVKCFADVKLELQSTAKVKTSPKDKDRQPNWNVILGENGDGKTSLLHGIAACLMDVTTADRMLKPDGWVREGAELGRLNATLVREASDRVLTRNGGPNPSHRVEYHVLDAGKKANDKYRPTGGIVLPDMLSGGVDSVKDLQNLTMDLDYLRPNAFSREPARGWFSAGYGPYRRLATSRDVAPSDDALACRFVTLFEESASLADCEAWLKEMERRALKSPERSHRRAMLEEIKQTIAKLLPEVDDLSIEDEVSFLVRGKKVRTNHLSHGYRSMFALSIDILRYLEFTRPIPLHGVLNELPGVVLIDEVDAHLHPMWQRKIGFWLCEAFPNLQFIVTSHSPFVAMAAAPGGLTVLKRDPQEGTVTAHQDVPDIRGWAADRVLTELFDMASLRDPVTETKLARYEDLRTKRASGKLGPRLAEELKALETELNVQLAGEADSPNQRLLTESFEYFAAGGQAPKAKKRA